MLPAMISDLLRSGNTRCDQSAAEPIHGHMRTPPALPSGVTSAYTRHRVGITIRSKVRIANRSVIPET